MNNLNDIVIKRWTTYYLWQYFTCETS